MGTNTHRSGESTADREVLVEFYTSFNHYVSDRGGRDELAATLSDDVVWTDVTNAGRSKRVWTGTDAVIGAIATPVRERTAHLQALPERFTEADDTVVVEGAYVGIADETEFDVPYVHVFELADATIQNCRAYTDTALERQVFEP